MGTLSPVDLKGARTDAICAAKRPEREPRPLSVIAFGVGDPGRRPRLDRATPGNDVVGKDEHADDEQNVNETAAHTPQQANKPDGKNDDQYHPQNVRHGFFPLFQRIMCWHSTPIQSDVNQCNGPSMTPGPLSLIAGGVGDPGASDAGTVY